MDAKIQALMAIYKDVDYTMAETLFKMHEQGKLNDYDFGACEPTAPSEPGKIHIAQNISELPIIECEATTPDSSSSTRL